MKLGTEGGVTPIVTAREPPEPMTPPGTALSTEQAHEPAKAGRPQSVTTPHMLAEARRLVDEVGAADFSVRVLAKALGLVPGTIHARFGNKHELLALLYLQRIEMAEVTLAHLTPSAMRDVASLLEELSPHLSTLRREFVLHFEDDGHSAPTLSPTSWNALKTSFQALDEHIYRCFREAAANEGVRLIGGSQARRLVWTLASTDSPRSSAAFEHADTSYRRFVAQALLAALSAD
jgi:AcrR family transcriptional regulator